MNSCWLIILLLLFCGQNGNRGGQNGNCGGQSSCGCEEPVRPMPPCRGPEKEPCPCEDSRFEPRFEQRPFTGNGSTCGCEGEGN